MKKINYNILMGCLIISIGLVTHGYITSNNISIKKDEPILMNMVEVTNYLRITEEQIIGIIETEKIHLANHSYSRYVWFPYFIVDNDYFFYKKSIDEWLLYVAESGHEFDTKNKQMNT